MTSSNGGFIEVRNGQFRVCAHRIAPESLFTTERLLKELRDVAPIASGRMLDIGCGLKPYKPVFASFVTHHIGCDVPSTIHGRQEIDVCGSAMMLPFADNSFQFVLCTEVLEHVPDPLKVYHEISRVLKPGGHAIVTTPFMYRIHEAPFDFFRYTPFSHRQMASLSRLQVMQIRSRGGYFSLLVDYLLKGLNMGCGAVGQLSNRLIGRGRNLPQTYPWKKVMELLQRILFTALRNERVKSDVYTLGYVVVLQKDQAG